jgi:hypothetical protein
MSYMNPVIGEIRESPKSFLYVAKPVNPSETHYIWHSQEGYFNPEEALFEAEEFCEHDRRARNWDIKICQGRYTDIVQGRRWDDIPSIANLHYRRKDE